MPVPALSSAPMPSKIWSISSEEYFDAALEQQVLEQVREPSPQTSELATREPVRDPEAGERDGSDGGHVAPCSRSTPESSVVVGDARVSSVSALPAVLARGQGHSSRGRAATVAAAVAAVTVAVAVAVDDRGHPRAITARQVDHHRRCRHWRSPRRCELLDRLAGDVRDRPARRRPMRPRSRSTSTTRTAELVTLVEHLFDRRDPGDPGRRWRYAAGRPCPWRAR